MKGTDMKIVRTDINGDEIAEVSVTELDSMFKEIREKTIDEFAEKLLEIAPKNYAGTLELGGCCNYLSARHIMKFAERMKGGDRNE